MPSDVIHFLHCHGAPGQAQTDQTNNLFYYGKNSPDSIPYNYEDISSFSNNKLALFLGCKMGATSDTYGNIVDILYGKTSDCAMGWTTDTGTDANDEYSRVFWGSIAAGNSIGAAHDAGLNYVRTNVDGCQATVWDGCGLANLYKKGGGCTKVLLEGRAFVQDNKINTINEMHSISQSPELIEKFKQNINQFSGGRPLTNLNYKGTSSSLFGDLDTFEANEVTFEVYHSTGDIQSAHWFNDSGSKQLSEVITIKQGAEVAEKMVKENSSALWDLKTAKTGDTVIQTSVWNSSKIRDRGDDRQFVYAWETAFHVNTANGSYDIIGPGSVELIINPYNGHITDYFKVNETCPLNELLIPQLTEEQAWTAALKYYTDQGVTNITTEAKANKGLRIFGHEEKQDQKLAWVFSVSTSDINNRGGVLYIDAHDGHVIHYMKWD
jgi:hypothetical protein